MDFLTLRLPYFDPHREQSVPSIQMDHATWHFTFKFTSTWLFM